MLPISELSALSLVWKQPSAWRREYVLVSDSGTHGQMAFTSFWKEVVEAQVGEQAWTFQRTGFFRRQVIITRAGEAAACATYYPNGWGSGGKLELGGDVYAFSSNFWQSRYVFSGADGGAAVVFHKGGVLRTSVTVEIAAEALRWEALPLLVTLGMVAILLHHQDAAATTAST